MKYYLAFDGETGGLDPDKVDLLTCFFAILDENFKVLDELDLKLKPEDRLPIAEAGALKVNGIDLQAHIIDPNTVTYLQGREKLLSLIKKYYKKQGRVSNITAFGYNIPFDIDFINKYLISKQEWNALVHYKLFDVMDDVDVLKRHGWLPSEVGKLTAAVEYFNIPMRNAHTAKDDIFMTIDVYKKISELMESRKNGGGQTQDLISLLESE